MNTKIHSPLESWLGEREIQRIIEDEYPFPAADDVDNAEEFEELEPRDVRRASLSECNPMVGEVRLLAPWDKNLLSRPPVYVLIMQQLDTRSFLVAPFSRYTQPATQREFLTTAPDAFEPATRNFRTICLWNSFVVLTDTLQNSWSFGKLSETDFQSAKTVFQWIQAADLDKPLNTALLPAPLQSRIGPPLADLDPIALFEVVTYLAEEQSWPEKIELAGLAVAEEAVPATAEIPESTRLAIPWRELLKSAARVPEGFGPPEDIARRFAVWVCDSPASQILQNAGKVTLSLLEEATRVWEKVIPKSEPGQLLWETEKSMVWSGGSQSLEPSYGFMGGGPPSQRRSVTLVHTPELPNGSPVLLIDGRTSQLLGRGETSKGGIQIELHTEIPPNATLQLILCRNTIVE